VWPDKSVLATTLVELAHALYGDTDGNPFFVSEALRHLVESELLVRDDGGR